MFSCCELGERKAVRKGGSYGLVNLRGITAHLREERKETEVGRSVARLQDLRWRILQEMLLGHLKHKREPYSYTRAV